MTPSQDTNKRDVLAALALMGAVILAMLIANSPLASNYQALLLRDVAIGIAPLQLTKSVLHWVNDGLMAIFFLLVGIEIKREYLAYLAEAPEPGVEAAAIVRRGRAGLAGNARARGTANFPAGARGHR